MSITAGLELDLAVAKACGFRDPMLLNDYCAVSLDGQKAFRPSTDLNDAFLAAEKFFGDKHWLICSRKVNVKGKKYGVCVRKDNADFLDLISEYKDDAALAICAAILNLAEKA